MGRSPGGGMVTHSSILAWRILTERGAWWTTVHKVAMSQTQLKRFSTHTHTTKGETLSLLPTSWCFTFLICKPCHRLIVRPNLTNVPRLVPASHCQCLDTCVWMLLAQISPVIGLGPRQPISRVSWTHPHILTMCRVCALWWSVYLKLMSTTTQRTSSPQHWDKEGSARTYPLWFCRLRGCYPEGTSLSQDGIQMWL